MKADNKLAAVSPHAKAAGHPRVAVQPRGLNGLRREGAELLSLLLLAAATWGIRVQPAGPPAPTVIAGRPDRILVRPLPGKSLAELDHHLGLRKLKAFPTMGGLEIVEVPRGTTADALINAYRQSGLVRYAEQDSIVHAQLEPNDPYFQNGTCW